MSLYEGMFLFDAGRVSEWSAVEQELTRLFERIGATQRVAIKYDERKLAYEIKKRKRGLYVLVYFEADSQKIGELERDARLSEVLLRVLILRAEGVTDERIEELKSKPADQSIAPPPMERRYGGDRHYGGGRDDRRGDRRPARGRDSERRPQETKADASDADAKPTSAPSEPASAPSEPAPAAAEPAGE